MHSEQISDGYCQCSVCISKLQQQQVTKQQEQVAINNQNSLLYFLQYLPRNFPIAIVPSAFTKSKLFYYNKSGNRLMIIPYSNRVTQHFPLATNVILYYPFKSVIAHKYEIMKEENSFLYVQAYSTKIPITIKYDRSDQFMDEVLSQKMQLFLKNIANEDSFNLTDSDKDFMVWIHQEYNEIIFCKFMTRFYSQSIQLIRKDVIISGQFQWIIQKLGLIRLSNIKNLVVQKIKKSTSFQQQYQQKIMQKLNSKDSLQVKLFNNFVKKSRINTRVNVFRNQIRQIFQKQKLKILQKTQKQRTVETKTYSDDVARLFLPQLSKYSSLRQVLNDKKKFKKVVLGIEEQKHQQSHRNHRKLTKSFQKVKSINKRHQRSYTQN